ncbi:hypothetical protein NEOLEDRAFT_1170310 [Neolentinus lepideus HHB14362 ss-1]|uniref:Uncharacterized protein n=1 Tax=Neolentinus lepideus HHB14362 ss-1 TaxID=1314782 RepID=A0A165RU82_9AGAM|nr:hypothetical protein NEOLEDRAFT_1170310 [Neolentinus lepideus HHB14362 ss-1]
MSTVRCKLLVNPALLIAKRHITKDILPDLKKDMYASIKKNIKDAEAGRRCWPRANQTTDKKYGIRFDWGPKQHQEQTTKNGEKVLYRVIDLHLNANAENEQIRDTVRKAKRGTHAKRMQIYIRVNEDGTLHKDFRIDHLVRLIENGA